MTFRGNTTIRRLTSCLMSFALLIGLVAPSALACAVTERAVAVESVGLHDGHEAASPAPVPANSCTDQGTECNPECLTMAGCVTIAFLAATASPAARVGADVPAPLRLPGELSLSRIPELPPPRV